VRSTQGKDENRKLKHSLENCDLVKLFYANTNLSLVTVQPDSHSSFFDHCCHQVGRMDGWWMDSGFGQAHLLGERSARG